MTLGATPSNDPSGHSRSRGPATVLTEALGVTLSASQARLADLTYAAVWGFNEHDGAFPIVAVGAASEGTQSQAKQSAQQLLAPAQPLPETPFGRVDGPGTTVLLVRALTNSADLPRGLLVLATSQGTYGDLHDVNDLEQHRSLHRLADQAQRALRRAEDLAESNERLRLAEVAREVVRTASAQLDLDDALESCTIPLAQGFDAIAARIRTYPTEDFPEAGTPNLGAEEEVVSLIHRLSHQLWAARRVGQVSVTRRDPLIASEREYGKLVTLLTAFGWGRALLAPIGAGNQCLGHVVLGRGQGSPAWTPEEEITAAEIGQDLGRAVLNARAFSVERQLVDDLRELDAYKSDLISMMSHHLRNPLATIVGHVELTANDAAIPDGARNSLDVVGRSTQRLTRVVEDLLVFAQVGDPRHPLEETEVDLNQTVVDVADQVAVTLQQRGQHLTITHSNQPVIAWGDPEELDRLIGNLLSNAVKYTPDGGHITITTAAHDHQVEVTVSDEGFGISDADQAELFTEFFRSTNPRALSQPGTGLGLAIVSRIAQRHHGRVEVESTLDVGSTFRVVLPSAGDASRR